MISRATISGSIAASSSGVWRRIRRLARPSATLANNARQLNGTSSEDLLAGLLIQLDETILPRRYRLTSDTGRMIDLGVAHRRLWPIVDGPEDTHADAPEDIVARLRDILEGAGTATLSSMRTDEPTTGPEPGIAISTLIAISEPVATPVIDPDPVVALWANLEDNMTAWVRLDGVANITGRGGDRPATTRLENLVRTGLKDIETQLCQSLSAKDQPGCLILNAGGGNGLALIYARSQHSGVLALLPADDLLKVQHAWRVVA